jgi:hypothetical protein
MKTRRSFPDVKWKFVRRKEGAAYRASSFDDRTEERFIGHNR